MKKFLVLIMILAFLFNFTGCTQLILSSTEIDKIFNTRIVGIDKLENGKIRMTITTKDTKPSENGSGVSEKSEILVSEGETVFEAVRTLFESSSKRPLYGHTEFVIIGEATAKDGILPFLDFVTRDNEFRYNAKIYIVKGDSAFNLIDKLSDEETYLADKLSALEHNSGKLSISSQEALAEAMYIFDKPNISTYLPYIEIITDLPSVDTRVKSNGNTISLNGYGIFKADKLQYFLSSQRSRGINWIRNKIQSGFIIVKGPDGKNISMEIISAKTSIKPSIKKGVLKCSVKVNFTTNVTETMSRKKIFYDAEVIKLQQQQEEQIKKEIEDIISYAQEKNLDIFGILSNFIMAYPPMKNELRQNWGKLFPEVQFSVKVDSKINRTYFLRESTGIR